ncbi:MAG: methionyl-tRNA formyltransferase [Acidobacteria bacterium]|nr:MAG: methionyl-tRNA formyltransferase [Acidobacteriota bacterium]GIU83128.1 MAG: methionyl-tRNA formyltransferase [Pyrinomonadaceae bacterium]
MKIVFMGTPKAAVVSLSKLLDEGHEIVAVYTQPDKPAGRGGKLTPPPIKEFALERGLKVLQPSKIRTAEETEIFRSHSADIAVVVAYGKILPPDFLYAFSLGAVNLHFSLLPKYRGAAPVNWAIARGEKITGVTTMKMDEELDAGDILLQREVQIYDDETAIELMERLSTIGADLLAETLKNLDKITPQKQNDELASYAPILKKEDGLIDWSMKAFEIANRIRGFQPFPTCFTFYQGKKLTLWKAKAVESSSSESEAGSIVQAKGDCFLVACGGGTLLKIEELQLEGKKRMFVKDFLNGTRLKEGEKFQTR